jgi:flagellar biosynthetic protein FlhB
MMADVAFADAVLVNPTHVAVAIKYTKHLGAPRVVAKGAGVIAARIREIATENRVPLVEDIPLARTLYRSCEVGTEIPPELFTAVARVLAFVINLKRRGVHAGLHHAREVDLTIPV